MKPMAVPVHRHETNPLKLRGVTGIHWQTLIIALIRDEAPLDGLSAPQ
jgi:hypothetical protein